MKGKAKMNEQEKKAAAPEWFSIKDAAEYLNIGEPTLYRWMRDRKITYRKVGDSTRFLKDDLDAIVQVYLSEKNHQEARQCCPVCHSEDLETGIYRSTGLTYFQLKKTKFWTIRDSNIKTEARMCNRCGAVTIFGDLEKLHKIKAGSAVEEPVAE